MQKTTTVRFEQETIALLDRIATSLGRPRFWIINDALTKYLAYEVWFLEEVQNGMDAADQGNFVSHEEVKNSIRRLGVNVD